MISHFPLLTFFCNMHSNMILSWRFCWEASTLLSRSRYQFIFIFFNFDVHQQVLAIISVGLLDFVYKTLKWNFVYILNQDLICFNHEIVVSSIFRGLFFLKYYPMITDPLCCDFLSASLFVERSLIFSILANFPNCDDFPIYIFTNNFSNYFLKTFVLFILSTQSFLSSLIYLCQFNSIWFW